MRERPATKDKKKKYLSSQPFVLMIVMLPFPPSVRIFVLRTTGFPEKAEVGYAEEGSSSIFCFDLDSGEA